MEHYSTKPTVFEFYVSTKPADHSQSCAEPIAATASHRSPLTFTFTRVHSFILFAGVPPVA